MKQFPFVIICLMYLASFEGCALFDSGSDHIAGDYYLTWIDLHRNRYIHKKDGEGVVGEMVFAVGHNDHFVWAKHAPAYWNKDVIIQDSIRYYVIEQTRNFVQNKPVYGPLQRESFDSLCTKFNILSPKFDIDYSIMLDEDFE